MERKFGKIYYPRSMHTRPRANLEFIYQGFEEINKAPSGPTLNLMVRGRAVHVDRETANL